MAKLDSQIAAHMTSEEAQIMRALADFFGVSTSEYIRRLCQKEIEKTQALAKCVSLPASSHSSMSTARTEDAQ